MLFDVLAGAGQREAFDDLSIDYAARFEKSPPAWREGGRTVAAPARPQAAGSQIAFPASIEAACERQVEQAQRAAAGKRCVTVDFSQVRSIDAAGATLLMTMIDAFRRAQRELVIAGAPRLYDAVRATVEPGQRDSAVAQWMLALEMLRVQGLRQQFDDLAIDYCVTFEVSPPSWEPMPAWIRTDLSAPAAAGADDEPGAPAESGAFPLVGEITGRIQKEIAALRAWAHDRRDVVVDCRDLVRLDFVAAGELLNEVVTLRSAGKSVLFVEPDFIVLALMHVMGIHELAEIRGRKI